jgi:PAS domain S-box-containing protein
MTDIDIPRGGTGVDALVRQHDWSMTSLGHPPDWPPSLRHAWRLILNTDQPMYILWGDDGICLYNDAFRRDVLSGRPDCLGRSVADPASMDPGIHDPHESRRPAVPAPRRGRRKLDRWIYKSSVIDDEELPGGGRGLLVICSRSPIASVSIVGWLEADRLRRLLQSAPGFILIMSGPTHVFEFANDSYIQSFGKEGCVGKAVRDVLPEIEGQGFFELLDTVFRTGERATMTKMPIEFVRAGGEPSVTKVLDFVYEPILDDDCVVIGIFCQAFDVTAHVATESALRETETALRELNGRLEREVVDRSTVGGRYWQICPDLLGVLDADGHYENNNPAWTAVLGWTTADLSPNSYLDILHPDDRVASTEAFEQLKAGDPVRRFENRLRGRDGLYRWFAWSAVPLGEAYFTSGKDITAEKLQQLELMSTSSERDRVWNNSRDILIVIDAAGIFRAVSPAWTAILGHEVSELIGRSCLQWVWPDDLPGAEARIATAVANKIRASDDIRHTHKDGTPRWISWMTSMEGGLVYGYGRDITEAKRAEAELASAREVLRQSQKMDAIGQLTGGLAHDFNNLLAGISGSLEVLSDDMARGCTDDAPRYIGSAQSAAKRASSLTQRLLAFSKRQILDAKPVNLNRLVAAMEDFVERAVGPAIRVEAVKAAGLWNVVVDANQLENSLLNLCINARDAMPDGGSLIIETGNRWLDSSSARDRDIPPGQYVSLSVSDTGTGMTPDVLARAFDPFFTTKAQGMGTGLGLSMVYGFTRQSGGQARISSQIGRGSSVCLYFPRYLGDTEVPAVSEHAVLVKGNGERVLVVDDEASVRMVVTDVLRKIGYDSVQASDALAGLKMLQSPTRIDLLVTDVGLPGGINGRQMAEAARLLRPELKVLFITGYAENVVMGHGDLDRGMEVLTKPFPMAELASRVSHLLALG